RARPSRDGDRGARESAPPPGRRRGPPRARRRTLRTGCARRRRYTHSPCRDLTATASTPNSPTPQRTRSRSPTRVVCALGWKGIGAIERGESRPRYAGCPRPPPRSFEGLHLGVAELG